MLKLVFIAITAACLSACTSIPFLQKADQAIISAVQKYCKEPQDARQTIRQAVNQGLAGSASVCVQCKGDAPDPACAPPK
jgi:hypothetical protein